MYELNRESVGGSRGYDNSVKSDLLFQARSNTLRVKAWSRHLEGSTECDLCGAVLEDLIHFLLHCPGVEDKRSRRLILEVGGVGTDIDVLGKLLFEKKRIQEVKRMIGDMWRLRLSRLRGAARLGSASSSSAYNLRDRSSRRRWCGRWGETE